jgi:hypothetical protein
MENKKFRNLVELTKKWSGIIVDDRGYIIVCNWLSIVEGIPQYDKYDNNIKGVKYDIELLEKKEIDKDEIIKLIENKQILYDIKKDLEMDYDYIFGEGGEMYKIKGGLTIICPFILKIFG